MDEIELRLATLLREDTSNTPDEGFSERVMAALPRRRFAGARARRLGMGAAAAVGGGLGLAFATPLEQLAGRFASGDAATWLVAMLFITLLSLPVIWIVSAD
jgi:hypothetical protein